jgi:predicted nuclease with TOPRIM domain
MDLVLIMVEKEVLGSRVERLEHDCDRIDTRLFELHSEVLKNQGENGGELKALYGYVDKLNTRVRYLEDEFKAQRTRMWAIILLILGEVVAQVLHLI